MELSDILPISDEVGYLALSLASFFGSLLPFAPFSTLPSFLLIATMTLSEKFDPNLIALVSAFSAVAAKQIIFYISYGGRKIIAEKTRKRIKPFERLVSRYGGFAAFLAAATPIPDYLIYIPLGLARYNPIRLLIASLAGTIFLGYAIVFTVKAFGTSYLSPLLEKTNDSNSVYLGIGIFALTITAMVVLMLRLDWEKILGKVAKWTVNSDKDEPLD